MKYLSIVIVSLVLLQPRAAVADPAGVFGNYTFVHPDFSDVHTSAGDHLNGWSAGIDVPVVGVLGAVGRVDADYGDTFKTGAIFLRAGMIERSSTVDVVGGPRVAFTAGRLSPWADATFGTVHATARAMGIDAFTPLTGTAFTSGVGGGLDVRLASHVDARVIDVEYRHATIFNQTLNRTSASFGVVWRFTTAP